MRLLANAVLRWAKEGGAPLGAAVAFHLLFAAAALLVVGLAVGGDGAALLLRGLVGPTAASAIDATIESAGRQPQRALAGTLGAAALLAAIGCAAAQWRRALGHIGRVAAPPPASGQVPGNRLTGFALTLGFVVLAMASLLLATGLAAIGTDSASPLAPLAATIVLLDAAVAAALLVVAFAALLQGLSDTAPGSRALWAGAGCTTALLVTATHLAGLYAGWARADASIYDAAGGLAVAMLWAYGSVQALLFGAALTAAVNDEHKGQATGSRPQPQPMPGTAPTRPVPAPTSLAAVRSSRRPPSLAARPRNTANGTWKGSGQLLIFPGRDKR
ncbi:YhjD/YihY/BrkB family envelope integrity protein [Piscinibacter sp.]|uniref:YhjD/YihY/BrkB family envelope integrity protein n=1 Tax=Piscinibacter sp. TaxID=1903157 RepID=UPI002B95AD30|nr:YhjD/YihY/BrkB family envelope integrity protein [Albitalea sp.]HUG24763.1 YhjD/YihY/BrkB family envelope integrity protein [Albitalea sp.]